MFRSLLFLSILSIVSVFAHEEFNPYALLKSSDPALQILAEQPDSIESIQGGKLYLKTERILLTKQGLFLLSSQSMIPLAAIFADDHGCYITFMNQ